MLVGAVVSNLSIGWKQEWLEMTFSTPTLQSLSSFNPDCNLLARVDFCQGDFQHLVPNSGRHIVWIYLMRQLENKEHLIGHFSLEGRSSLLFCRCLSLLCIDDQAPSLGPYFHVFTCEPGEFGSDRKASTYADDCRRDWSQQLGLGAKPVFTVMAVLRPSGFEQLVGATGNRRGDLSRSFDKSTTCCK